MTFFYNFTDSLKGKWLQFFQVNRDWVKLHMEIESVYTPDGGKRPPSYLILGVVNALEPKLAQLMLPFSRLNTDADTLVEVLGLNFDPDVALGNCVQPDSAIDEDSMDSHASEYAMEMMSYTEESPQDMVVDSSETGTQNAMSAEFDYENITFHSSEEVHRVRNSSEADFAESPATNDGDAFDDISGISFDDLQDSQTANSAVDEAEGSIEEQMFDISASTDDVIDDDVIRDVWSEESTSQNGEAAYQFGEEMSTDSIDNMEVEEIFSHN